MAKKTKKRFKSNLKLEALEQRQLLAGITGSGTELTPGGSGADKFIVASNGNHYDQVLLTGTSVSVTNDSGNITRVSFLDLQGDIVQAEFGGAGTLTISLDPTTAVANAPATKYNQTINVTAADGTKITGYEQGLASFTISGSDATTNFTVFSVGANTAFAGNTLFDATHTGGDHTADIAKITVVADTSKPNGSVFGGIRAGNAIFSADSGVVGIAAANVQVQDVVTVGDIKATGTATPTLVFGTSSQFGSVTVAGGGLVEANGKAINNTGSYNFGLVLAAGQDSSGAAVAAKTAPSGLSFSGNNPLAAQVTTFTLTSGVDTIIGSTGSDQINGTDTTITGLDSIDGGLGTDTLTVNDVTGTTAAGANLALLTVKNVEALNVNSVGGLRGDALDTSSWTGLTSEVLTLNTATAQTVTAAKTTAVSVVNSGAGNLTVVGGGGAVVVQDGAGAVVVGATGANSITSASVKGGTTVNVTDRSGSSAAVGAGLTTATVDGNTGLATLTSDGLTNVTLANDSAGASLVTTKALALNLTVNNVTGGTVTDTNNKYTGITVNTATKDTTHLTLTSTSATSLTLNPTGAKLTLDDINLNAVTKITLTGSKDTTISATTGVGALTSVDASGATGPVTITPALGNGVTFTGGSGGSNITVGQTTKTITTGGGNDTVTIAPGTTALGTGGSVDAGGGTNTLKVAPADAAAANFAAGSLVNFQKLAINNAGANTTVDVSKLLNIGSVDASGTALGFTLTLNNLPANPTLTFTAATAGSTTVNLANATGAADVLNVNITKSNAALAAGTVNAPGIETINLTLADDKTSGANDTLTIADTSLATLKVTGSAGVTLGTLTGATALTSIDASGVTTKAAGVGISVTTDALLSAATIKGSSNGNDAITASAATKAVTVTGGDGSSTVTIANANNNSVTLGKGNNMVTLGGGTNSVTVGAGNNSVTTGAGADTIVVGNGTNTISSGTGLDVVTAGTGVNTFQITTPINGDSYVTLNGVHGGGATSGDQIQFLSGAAGTFTTAKITLADTASFQGYLAAATSGGAGTASWFQYNGNTYVVEDNSAAAVFQNGADAVVKLTGLIDLSNSTIAAGVLTIV